MGGGLVALLEHLEKRFNGHVFAIDEATRKTLVNSTQLEKFANLVDGRRDRTGQYRLWRLYSFEDLPVELISQVYQLFVEDPSSSVYTPPFLVRLILDEAMSWERIDRLHDKGEVVLDPCCGSGVFLVEAYKRLVLHWRYRNEWKCPDKAVLQALVSMVHGIDSDQNAIELAAFSMCLAICDALEPATLRESINLFPPLVEKTLHHSCFFAAKERELIRKKVGIVIGNPPFKAHSGDEAVRSPSVSQSTRWTVASRALALIP